VARKLEYLEQALIEAEAAAQWYRKRSPTAATRFSGELDEAEAAILEHPEAWPIGEQGTRRYFLRHFPFAVIYRVEESRLLIVAVAHARRRPGYWAHRA
jgi:plasmid stabilization system protein ParE